LDSRRGADETPNFRTWYQQGGSPVSGSWFQAARIALSKEQFRQSKSVSHILKLTTLAFIQTHSRSPSSAGFPMGPFERPDGGLLGIRFILHLCGLDAPGGQEPEKMN
jgi:hypothetical protein